VSKNYLYNTYLCKWRKEDAAENEYPHEPIDMVELSQNDFRAWRVRKQKAKLLAEVKEILMGLKPLERNILLESVTGTPVVKIAERLNWSRQHVHKIISDAMDRVRQKVDVITC